MNITHTGKLLNYVDLRKHGNIFVETGTAMGDGVERAVAAGFESIISIEAQEEYYDHSIQRFFHNKNVLIWHAKSTEGLKKLKLSNTENIVFYLDAHPAGPNSAGHEEWLQDPNGEANQDNIIKAELAIILTHYPGSVVVIDDVNGMADGCAQGYMNLFTACNPDAKFEFWDENLSGTQLYKDKILVCLP